VTADEVQKLYPVESTHFKKLVDHHGRFWARPPLGESRFDVRGWLIIAVYMCGRLLAM
jgi:hypothetical protein